MDLVLRSGIFGLLILLVSPALLLGGILTIALTRSRRMLAIFAMLACLPLALGLCGTFLGMKQVEAVARTHPDEWPERPDSLINVSKREAMMPIRMGGLATAGLLVAAGVGMMVTKGR